MVRNAFANSSYLHKVSCAKFAMKQLYFLTGRRSATTSWRVGIPFYAFYSSTQHHRCSSKLVTNMDLLPEVEQLSPSCIRILGGNPGKFTLQGTNTYLLGTGPERLLIDTGQGIPSWKRALKSTLEQQGKVTVKMALITHRHHDHVGGISDLVDLCPQVRIFKAEPEIGQHSMVEGQTFQVPGATIKAWATPGHTTDHTVFVLEEEGAIFTGDNVLGHGTAVFEDLKTYIQSLERMADMVHEPGGRAYPGHGPVIVDGVGRIRFYLEHRRQREMQIKQALGQQQRQEAGLSAMELVKEIYKDVPESLHEAACKGVLQVLEKLYNDGTVSKCEVGSESNKRTQWMMNSKMSKY